MAVWLVHCPGCGNEFRSFVMEGARVPSVWSCSRCGGREAIAVGTADGGPFSGGGGGCGCGCG